MFFWSSLPPFHQGFALRIKKSTCHRVLWITNYTRDRSAVCQCVGFTDLAFTNSVSWFRCPYRPAWNAKLIKRHSDDDVIDHHYLDNEKLQKRQGVNCAFGTNARKWPRRNQNKTIKRSSKPNNWKMKNQNSAPKSTWPKQGFKQFPTQILVSSNRAGRGTRTPMPWSTRS